MEKLKNGVRKILEMNVQTGKVWRILFALGLVAMSGLAPIQAAQADAGGMNGTTFEVTFTKWVTSLPANPPSVAGVLMSGVVGGDVGDGRFAGKVLRDDLSVPGFWLAKARYGFYGDEHSFLADVRVVENDTTNPATAVVTGVIVRGWQKGAHLTGGYTVMPECPIPTPGNVFGTVCFQGTLHIHPDDGS